MSPRIADDPLDPHGRSDELAVDGALRPPSLEEFRGQPRVSEQLGLVLAAAQHRGAVPDHVLLSGPPGLGKTTLAMNFAHELGRRCGSARGRRSSTRATWPPSCPDSPRARCSSWMRSTG